MRLEREWCVQSEEGQVVFVGKEVVAWMDQLSLYTSFLVWQGLQGSREVVLARPDADVALKQAKKKQFVFVSFIVLFMFISFRKEA